MRILTDPPTIPVVLHVEPGDTVADITYCVALLSGTRGRSGVLPREEATRFVVEVQPNDDRQPFSFIVPKQADIDANRLELCSLYAASGRQHVWGQLTCPRLRKYYAGFFDIGENCSRPVRIRESGRRAGIMMFV